MGRPSNPHDTDAAVRRQTATLLTAAWAVLLVAILAAPFVGAVSDRGEFLIRNTVRLALAYWAIAVARMLIGRPARTAWTLGCAAYLVHVAMAFEHAHHWSHAEAFRHVEAVGGGGEGIFVSYLFTLLWAADTAWWWADQRGHEGRPRRIGWVVHGFMVFVIVNATVVFEGGVTRWLSAAVLLVLMTLWLLVTVDQRSRLIKP